MINENLIFWADLSQKFDLPDSDQRTYNIIHDACHSLKLPKSCIVDDERFHTYTLMDDTL